MKKHPAILSISLLFATVFLFFESSLRAEQIDSTRSETIVKALGEQPQQATRSLISRPAAKLSLSDNDQNFINSVGTRGLKVETIDRMGKILDDNSLPSLDIEISFEFDSAKISDASKPDLSALGKALKHERIAPYKILLNGHTDAKGDNEYNLELSQDRAEAVKDYLVREHAIDASRLIALGFGEKRLKQLEAPEAAINRRVEIVNTGVLN